MTAIRKSPEWIEKYYAKIGASNAAVACGLSPWQSRSGLARIMLGQEEPEDVSDKPDVLRGVLCENAAIFMLARELGRTLAPHDQDDFQYSELYPHAHVLPDAWDFPRYPPRGDTQLCKGIPCEVKCVRRATLAKMQREQSPGDAYTLQCVHALAVTGAPYMHFGALNLEDMRLYYQRIERDDDLINSVMDIESEFYLAVKRGEIPQDGPQIAEFDAPSSEKKIITDPKALDTARQYLEVKQTKADASALFDSLKDDLLSHIGEANVFEFKGVLRGSNIPVKGRTTFDHKFCVKAHPAMKEYYGRGKPHMRFAADPVRK